MPTDSASDSDTPTPSLEEQTPAKRKSRRERAKEERKRYKNEASEEKNKEEDSESEKFVNLFFSCSIFFLLCLFFSFISCFCIFHFMPRSFSSLQWGRGFLMGKPNTDSGFDFSFLSFFYLTVFRLLFFALKT
jgi:hypothetical protein